MCTTRNVRNAILRDPRPLLTVLRSPDTSNKFGLRNSLQVCVVEGKGATLQAAAPSDPLSSHSHVRANERATRRPSRGWLTQLWASFRRSLTGRAVVSAGRVQVVVVLRRGVGLPTHFISAGGFSSARWTLVIRKSQKYMS